MKFRYLLACGEKGFAEVSYAAKRKEDAIVRLETVKQFMGGGKGGGLLGISLMARESAFALGRRGRGDVVR